MEPNDALHPPGPASFSGLGKQQSLTGPSVICNAGFPTTSYTSSLLGLLPPIIWIILKPYAGSPETVCVSFSGRTVVPSSAPMSLGGFQLHLLVATTLTLHTALISLFVTADRLAVQHVIL